MTPAFAAGAMHKSYLFRPLRKKSLCGVPVSERLRSDAAAFDFALSLLERDPQADEIAVRLGAAHLFTVKRPA